MSQQNTGADRTQSTDIALIVGGGPGISASCAKLVARSGMRVAIAARDPNKPVLVQLQDEFGVHRIACDAGDADSVAAMFRVVTKTLGVPRLVVHNIDGRDPDLFRKTITEADPALVLGTLKSSAYGAFLVGQQAARLMLNNPVDANGAKGTVIFTNATAALKGFPLSAAFAMACQAKSGLAQSMARELMPQGIHIASVPIDAAIGWRREVGTRAHRLAGTAIDDNLADPDCVAETYLHLHRQHRSTWTFEVVLRPWTERW